jgi:hypothetical protein
LDNGETSHEGRGDVRRDTFVLLVGKIQKDIDDLIKICQRLMTLNLKKAPGSKEQNDQ